MYMLLCHMLMSIWFVSGLDLAEVSVGNHAAALQPLPLYTQAKTIFTIQIIKLNCWPGFPGYLNNCDLYILIFGEH